MLSALPGICTSHPTHSPQKPCDGAGGVHPHRSRNGGLKLNSISSVKLKSGRARVTPKVCEPLLYSNYSQNLVSFFFFNFNSSIVNI